jgi:hypothetical protein
MAELEKQINPAFEALIQLRDRHPEAYALIGPPLRYQIACYAEPHDEVSGQTHAEWRAAVGLTDGFTRILPEVRAGMEPHAGLSILVMLKWQHPLAFKRLDYALQDLVDRYAALRATGQI